MRVSLVAGVVLSACGDVRSLSPAITSAEAIDLPDVVGRWAQGHPDSAAYILEIVPDSARSRVYRMRLSIDRVAAESLAAAARREGESWPSPADTSSGWLDARVGRIGERLVLESTPEVADSVLERARQRFSPLVITAWQLRVLAVTPTQLRLAALKSDTALAHVRAGRCATPYARDTSKTLTLTGSSPQVRRAYACLLQGRHALDSAKVFTRMSPVTAPAPVKAADRPPT